MLRYVYVHAQTRIELAQGAGDDEESFAWLTWNNPFVGSNKIGAMAYYDGPPLPPPSTDHLPFPSAYYVVAAVCGAGDKDAEMRYTIKRR